MTEAIIYLTECSESYFDLVAANVQRYSGLTKYARIQLRDLPEAGVSSSNIKMLLENQALESVKTLHFAVIVDAGTAEHRKLMEAACAFIDNSNIDMLYKINSVGFYGIIDMVGIAESRENVKTQTTLPALEDYKQICTDGILKYPLYLVSNSADDRDFTKAAKGSALCIAAAFMNYSGGTGTQGEFSWRTLGHACFNISQYCRLCKQVAQLKTKINGETGDAQNLNNEANDILAKHLIKPDFPALVEKLAELPINLNDLSIKNPGKPPSWKTVKQFDKRSFGSLAQRFYGLADDGASSTVSSYMQDHIREQRRRKIQDNGDACKLAEELLQIGSLEYSTGENEPCLESFLKSMKSICSQWAKDAANRQVENRYDSYQFSKVPVGNFIKTVLTRCYSEEYAMLCHRNNELFIDAVITHFQSRKGSYDADIRGEYKVKRNEFDAAAMHDGNNRMIKDVCRDCTRRSDSKAEPEVFLPWFTDVLKRCDQASIMMSSTETSADAEEMYLMVSPERLSTVLSGTGVMGQYKYVNYFNEKDMQLEGLIVRGYRNLEDMQLYQRL